MLRADSKAIFTTSSSPMITSERSKFVSTTCASPMDNVMTSTGCAIAGRETIRHSARTPARTMVCQRAVPLVLRAS